MRIRALDWAVVAAGCALLLGIYYFVSDKWLARALLVAVGAPVVIWLQRRHRGRTS